jgi:hypothetical protein
MSLSWLPPTGLGPMVGDYISTSWVGRRAFPVIALAKPPTGPALDEAMYVPTGGLPAG